MKNASLRMRQNNLRNVKTMAQYEREKTVETATEKIIPAGREIGGISVTKKRVMKRNEDVISRMQ